MFMLQGQPGPRPPRFAAIHWGHHLRHTLDEARVNAGEALTLEIHWCLEEGAEIPKSQVVDAHGVEVIERIFRT